MPDEPIEPVYLWIPDWEICNLRNGIPPRLRQTREGAIPRSRRVLLLDAEQEPVAYLCDWGGVMALYTPEHKPDYGTVTPLYAGPPEVMLKSAPPDVLSLRRCSDAELAEEVARRLKQAREVTDAVSAPSEEV